MSLRQHTHEGRYIDHQDLYDPFAEQDGDNVPVTSSSFSNAEVVAHDHKPASSLYSTEHKRERDLMDTETSSTNYIPRSSRHGDDPHFNFQSDSDFRQSSASDLKPLGYSDDDPTTSNYMKSAEDKHSASLIGNAADMGRAVDEGRRTGKERTMHDLELQEPYYPIDRSQNAEPAKSSFFSRFIADGRYPIEQRIEDKKRGIGRQKYPYIAWALTAVMIAILIYELVVNGRAQGTPISFKPVVNPMLGPSSSALINLGARFPPCMKNVTEVPVSLSLPCLNDTANPPDRVCPISDLCGFGGIQNNDPNQWFRFITPIFLHAGIIHLLLNMLAQVFVAAQVEREMGSSAFLITYFAAGIFGNVLGGNFALVGIPSVGASGAIFGTVAVAWVDLFAHWKYQYRPVARLITMAIELVVGIAIGFIPYVDNFAHLGGFLMGLLVGTIFYPVISTSRRHKLIMWAFRLAAIPLAVVLFVVLIKNFYTSDPYAACKWCRYLSCIPTSANNHCQGTGITQTSSSLKRSFS